MSDLDQRVMDLAALYRPVAERILKEAVRIPADHVKKDPASGLSNHEQPRLEYLRAQIVAEDAVARPQDVFFDRFGNLRWSVTDEDDGVAPSARKVVLMEGHTDTVAALAPQWTEKLGPGLDAYRGLIDADAVDEETLRDQLGWLPPRAQWEHLVFGRGSADQLSGVVAQIVATKILLLLKAEGALRGVTVQAMGTVAEEDNDGGGPMFLHSQEWPQEEGTALPDVVLLTEGTGDAEKGALGIYRGQRGRMTIEVEVTGRSCHGSMPEQGLNPLEYGAAILVDARVAFDGGEGFAQDPFLGGGTRTASWARLDTPSDCAVPERFVFRFDRRLTQGETADRAVADVAGLDAVRRAREAGLTVDVRVPHYRRPTWRGYEPDNAQIYPSWQTPAQHPAVLCAVDAYRRVVSPRVPTPAGPGATLRPQPRVDRWVFSTDGVGYVMGRDALDVPAQKHWVMDGDLMYPPMVGIGPGVEQNTHKVGEFVDLREVERAVAVLARFPSLFADR